MFSSSLWVATHCLFSRNKQYSSTTRINSRVRIASLASLWTCRPRRNLAGCTTPTRQWPAPERSPSSPSCTPKSARRQVDCRRAEQCDEQKHGHGKARRISSSFQSKSSRTTTAARRHFANAPVFSAAYAVCRVVHCTTCASANASVAAFSMIYTRADKLPSPSGGTTRAERIPPASLKHMLRLDAQHLRSSIAIRRGYCCDVSQQQQGRLDGTSPALASSHQCDGAAQSQIGER